MLTHVCQLLVLGLIVTNPYFCLVRGCGVTALCVSAETSCANAQPLASIRAKCVVAVNSRSSVRSHPKINRVTVRAMRFASAFRLARLWRIHSSLTRLVASVRWMRR